MSTHGINAAVLLCGVLAAGALVAGAPSCERRSSAQTSGIKGSSAPRIDSVGESASVGAGASPSGWPDAQGREFQPEAFQRVVSLHTTADRVLPQLVEAKRIAAVSGYSRDKHPEGWRLSHWPSIADSKDLESILALEPDLVIVSTLTDASVAERLREQGVTVFVLGTTSGLDTMYEAIQSLGVMLKVKKRAQTLIRRYKLQQSALEHQAAEQPALLGMYLSVYGDSFFGGTRGSSYADLLRLGGIADLAAQNGYEKWPKFSLEQLLALDPELVVTPTGGAKIICDHSGIRRIRACGPSGRFIEMEEALLSDPGPGLLDAAAQLQTILRSDVPKNPGT